jgi:hypothetical protein
MNIRTLSVALAVVALLSTAAGCARPGQSQAAAAPSHPVVSFAVRAAPAANDAEHLARFEVEVEAPTHIDPAGASRR